MRVFGKMISEMAGVLNVILMVTLTMAHFRMGKHMAKEFILGIMEKFMMGSGIKG